MERLFDIWPTVAALAEALKLPVQTVYSWRSRGIPHRRFPELIAAAKSAGHDLTYEELLAVNDRLDAERRERGLAS